MSKVALVTGASRGIGRAVARRLAADGFRICVNYVREGELAENLVAEIGEGGGTAVAIQADIADLVANRDLFEKLITRFGRLDVLVNNAGIAELGPFAAIDAEAYDRIFAIARGTYFAMQNAMPRLSEGGRIINLSTGLTRGWAPMAAAYAGSKAAIEQFTRSLSKEAGARGITVNAVLPGVTRTEILAGASADQLERARSQTSFGRLGEPEDIADVIAFLASEDARWITGQTIVVNGGSTP